MTAYPYRRNSLANVNPEKDTHAGLWLDKYLKDDSQNAKPELVKQVTDIETSEIYKRFFRRWQNTLTKLGAEPYYYRVIGRLAINLGADGVLETSIALHRTYGVPYIPGSALKGLAAHYVKTYLKDDPAWWENDSEMYRYLFGDTGAAGYVTFYDALLVPDDRRKHPLKPDVITVHHPHYYQGTKPDYYSNDIQLAPPADWDSPTPIPLITATGVFLIALSGPPNWVQAASDILELALEREGIGAKTSSGYGRMRRVAEEIHYIDQFEAVPELNDYFRGEVLEVQDNALLLLIPGLDGDVVHAYISLEAPGRFNEGDRIKCQVVGLKEIGATTRVICKRV